MICINCGTMFPAHYDKCPKCSATEAKQTQYKTNKNTYQELFEEPVGIFVIGSEISTGDTDFQY